MPHDPLEPRGTSSNRVRRAISRRSLWPMPPVARWHLVQRAPVPPQQVSPSSAEIIHQAVWFMAAVGFRAARAAISVIRVGYEDQAIVYVRLLTELVTRAQNASGDHTAQYTRQWLVGSPIGKPAKLIEQDVYEVLSGAAHANARAVREWLALAQEDGSTGVVVGPERRPESANASLTCLAGALGDLALLLGRAAGIPTDHLAALTATIVEAQDDHLAGDES